MTQGISAALDRLSSFAFKEAGEKAQREGMQYGAENMPSAEQVMRAMEEGQLNKPSSQLKMRLKLKMLKRSKTPNYMKNKTGTQ
jgi:hypothetical protein